MLQDRSSSGTDSTIEFPSSGEDFPSAGSLAPSNASSAPAKKDKKKKKKKKSSPESPESGEHPKRRRMDESGAAVVPGQLVLTY